MSYLKALSFVVVFTLSTFFGIVITESSTETKMVNAISSGERVLRSSVRIQWGYDGGVSSGILLGKRPVAKSVDLYEYFVLTAAHSIYDYVGESTTFDVRIHAWINIAKVPELITEKAEMICLLSQHDILLLRIESALSLPTAKQAPIFEPLDLFNIGDRIFVVGSDKGQYPVLRAGALASKFNAILSNPRNPNIYSRSPETSFCPSADIVGGASGGPVTGVDGTIIGMVLAVLRGRQSIGGYVDTPIGTKPMLVNGYVDVTVEHMSIALKFSYIKLKLHEANMGYAFQTVER